MMNNDLLSVSLLLIAALAVSAALVHPKDKVNTQATSDFAVFAESIMADWGVPGMAVSVIKDGKVVYSQCFGMRDLKRGLPVTPLTQFAIGSCTKAFTSMAAGMLVDEGKFDWDTPVGEYAPDFQLYDEYASRRVTIRDLLCHRTGLSGVTDILWMSMPLEREDYYRRLRFLKPSKGFREAFQYNNLIYTIAGELIGRVHGDSWEDFVRARIFKPLQMEHSNFSIINMQKSADFALPYIAMEGKPTETPFRNIDSLAPAGGINSNLQDMTNWLLLNMNKGRREDNQIISESSIAQLQNPQMVITDNVVAELMQSSTYGLGWFVTQYRGHRLVEHGGNIDGFSALVSFLPEDGVGTVILTNSMNMMTYVIARGAYDRLLGLDQLDWNSRYKELFELAKSASPLFDSGSKHQRKGGTHPSLPLANYTGDYLHPAFGRLVISADDGNLSCTWSGRRAAFTHFQYDVFTLRLDSLPPLRARFQLDFDGEVESLAVELGPGGEEIEFSRVK